MHMCDFIFKCDNIVSLCNMPRFNSPLCMYYSTTSILTWVYTADHGWGIFYISERKSEILWCRYILTYCVECQMILFDSKGGLSGLIRMCRLNSVIN